MTTMISKHVKEQLWKQGWTDHQVNYIVNEVTEYVTPGVESKINSRELKNRMCAYLNLEEDWKELSSNVVSTLHLT